MLCVATIGMHFGLPGETEELFVSSRIAFADGGEVLVFVAEKENLTEMPVLFRFNLRDAIEYRAFEIEFHHYADGLGQSGVHTDGEIERTNRALLNEPGKRRQRLSVLAIGVELRVVTLTLRTENSLHFRVVVKERKENGNAFDDRGTKLGLDPFPILVGTTFGLRIAVRACLGPQSSDRGQ